MLENGRLLSMLSYVSFSRFASFLVFPTVNLVVNTLTVVGGTIVACHNRSPATNVAPEIRKSKQ